MSRATLLGIDGGGTSTIAWIADEAGVVLGRGKSGPSNMKVVGSKSARESLGRSITGAFEDAGIPPRAVEVACLGLAGFDRPEDRRHLEEWTIDASWSRRLVLVNDGDLVVAAGTPEGWGVGVIAGTGSIAVGRSAGGDRARAGGWGPLYGDEGSAYEVARAGLRMVARRADGRSRGPIHPDPLETRICRALGIGGASELVSAIYHPDVDRTRVAALAPSVVEAAEEDPSIVREILEPAGLQLAEMVAAVAVKLGWSRGPLPLGMAGSFLLNCSKVSSAMIRALTDRDYDVQTCPVPEPVRGALVLAKRGFSS